jgi:hypothetical protein
MTLHMACWGWRRAADGAVNVWKRPFSAFHSGPFYLGNSVCILDLTYLSMFNLCYTTYDSSVIPLDELPMSPSIPQLDPFEGAFPDTYIPQKSFTPTFILLLDELSWY